MNIIFDNNVLLIIITIELVIFNLYSSYRCLKSVYSDKTQKILQILFLWLAPVIGAVLVIYFSREPAPCPTYKSSDANDSIASSEAGGGGAGD